MRTRKMKYSSQFFTPYLRAGDLPPEGASLTIAEVALEKMGFPREEKLVVSFDEMDKRLVLNKTNAMTLARAFGDDTQASVGQVVDLVVVPSSFDGKPIDVIRIEIPAVQPRSARSRDPERASHLQAAPAVGEPDDDIPF
jgi:hypothetical protein